VGVGLCVSDGGDDNVEDDEGDMVSSRFGEVSAEESAGRSSYIDFLAGSSA